MGRRPTPDTVAAAERAVVRAAADTVRHAEQALVEHRRGRAAAILAAHCAGATVDQLAIDSGLERRQVLRDLKAAAAG